jgi:hypothetical protein
MITQKIGATHGFDANSVFCPTDAWCLLHAAKVPAASGSMK